MFLRLKITPCGTLIVLLLDTCGHKALFSTLDECNGGMVTFGDRATISILGKGTVNTVNRVYPRPKIDKPPNEIFKSKKSFVKYFRVFGNKC